ncbi:MAG: coniferyl-alcohol dehydrogenase [Gordonia sp. (in: high G+C Gram-positive bacteria)]
MTTTYLVTGAASGIGLALATRLLDHQPGVRVIGLDLVPSPDVRVESVRCDLADLDMIDRLDLPGHVDAIANVAGVPGTAPAETVLAVNILGLRALTARTLDSIPPGGAIVNVASIAAHRNTLDSQAIDELLDVTGRSELRTWLAAHPIGGPAAYDTSKRALIDWTVRLSAQLHDRGIRVNSVSPGPTDTPILADFASSMGADAIARSAQTVGRHGSAAESAAAVEFLLSADASWINGIDLPVEGGLTALRAAASHPPLIDLQRNASSAAGKGVLR